MQEAGVSMRHRTSRTVVVAVLLFSACDAPGAAPAASDELERTKLGLIGGEPPAQGEEQEQEDELSHASLLEAGWSYAGVVEQVPMPTEIPVPPATEDVSEDEAIVTLVLSDGSAYEWHGPSPAAGGEAMEVAPPDAMSAEEIESLPLFPGFVGAYKAAKARGKENDFFEDVLRGDIRPQHSILGTDDRSLLSGSALEDYPFSTMGRVLGFDDDLPGPDTAGCSGAMVGPRHVLTAGHCVYDTEPDPDVWYSPLYFHPAADGDEVRLPPVLQMSARWARGQSLSYDYAIIAVQNTADAAALGYMNLHYYSTNATYTNKPATVQGYPVPGQACADSPLGSGECGGYQYFDNCLLSNATNTYVYYDCDAWAGQSGAPVWAYIYVAAYSAYVPSVLAIHKRDNDGCGCTVPASPATLNLGPRLREYMYDDICNWISMSPSSYGYPEGSPHLSSQLAFA